MVKIENKWNEIVVLIRDLPHVSVKKELLTGMHSWIEGYGADATFHIRFYMAKGRDVKCEYWDQETWTLVLTELKKCNLFGDSGE